MADPIHQFQIQKIATLGHIGGHEIAFTNSSLYMVVAVAGIAALMLGHRPQPGAGPHAVGRRNVLRIRRRHAAIERRHCTA